MSDSKTIRILGKQHVIKGQVTQGVVKPFGGSSHIILDKKHRGKNASVIIPEIPSYSWILDNKNRQEFIDACTKVIESSEGKMQGYKMQTIECLNDDRFELDVLLKSLDILFSSSDPKHIELYDKIKEAYGLK